MTEMCRLYMDVCSKASSEIYAFRQFTQAMYNQLLTGVTPMAKEHITLKNVKILLHQLA